MCALFSCSRFPCIPAVIFMYYVGAHLCVRPKKALLTPETGAHFEAIEYGNITQKKDKYNIRKYVKQP